MRSLLAVLASSKHVDLYHLRSGQECPECVNSGGDVQSDHLLNMSELRMIVGEEKVLKKLEAGQTTGLDGVATKYEEV